MDIFKCSRACLLIVFFVNFFQSTKVLALENIDLSACFEIAAQNNPEYLKNKTELERIQLNLKASYGKFLPTVSVGADQSKFSSNYQAVTQMSKVSQLSLDANINLFNGFADKAVVDISKLNVQIAQAQLDQTNVNLTYNIKQAYYEVLYANEFILLLEKIKVRRKQQFEMIQLRFEGGREDKGSYLQAQAKYENAEFEVQQATRLLETAVQRLSYTLGFHQVIEKKVTGELISQNPIQIDLSNLESIVKETPSYIIVMNQAAVSDKQVTQTNANFWPTLNLTGSSGKSGDSFAELNQDTWSVGLNLKVPLFEGGSRFFNSSAAYKNKLSKEYEFSNAFNSLKADLVSAFNNYKNYLQNIKVQNQFLEASRLRAEVTTGQYKSGLTTYTSWDLVQNEFINYEKSKLLSLRNLLLAEAELKKTMGHGELK